MYQDIVPNRFLSKQFTVHSISELTGIPRRVVARTVQDLNIPYTEVKTGATTRKMYDWDAYARIVHACGDKYISHCAPKLKCKVAVNQKGGVGKTTTTQQLAMYYATMGLKTLVIDNDPQGHCTMFFGVDNSPGGLMTLKDVYAGKIEVTDIIVKLNSLLHLIPSNTDLSIIEIDLITDINGRNRLKKIMNLIKDDYDIILIDNNPSFTWVTLNAICAADEICFICETALYSIDGMHGLFEVLEKLEEANPSFCPVLRVIPTKFKNGEKTSMNSLHALRSNYPDLVTNAMINESAAFGNATELREAVFLSPFKRSKAAEDIKLLAEELLNVPATEEPEDSCMPTQKNVEQTPFTTSTSQ